MPRIGLTISFTLLALLTTARAQEPHIVKFSDPKHPLMLAWKVDAELTGDVSKLQIQLDNDFWDPKVEGDAFSKRHLNSAVLSTTSSTFSFEILLSTKESIIVLNGHEYHGKGTSLVSDKKAQIISEPARDDGTGGFMLVRKADPHKPADQITSYFDYESWVLLTLLDNPE